MPILMEMRSLSWTVKQKYELIGNSGLTESVLYSLSDESLALIIDTSIKGCTVRANAKNKLGKVILTATYKGINYTKEIKVAPLW